ncbi:nucleolar complex-associated protein-domain-containing protein [Umbelopsis sp. AD052]|nr:nucleolar complex-associated protein-domain-containing protein [Umbelopsis sp. AD052]
MEDDQQYIGSDEEQDYELKPRKVSSEWTKKDKFTKLPIKLPGGKWEQAAEEYSDEDEEEPVPEIDSELSEIEMEDSAETQEPKKKTFLARKEELAQIASTIMEDPESNIGLLRTLKSISEDKNPKIAQLALLTQLAVYKDIVPGYRVRQLTDKEEAMEVSRDVKKVRAFEQTLLASYQAYLTDLEQMSKNSEDLEDKNAMVATQCMCQLLTNLTHFNFRLNLMTAIIAKMSTVHWTKTSEICCNAMIEVFRSDETGEASLDAVKLISRMVKSKGYLINESVINTFLHLRLKDELPPIADQDGENMKGKKRPKSNRPHVSKKQRKVNKENREVEKEMKEAEEVVTKEEKDKTHTETLKLVFACYFRVLKHHQTSKLLPAVLEGLAKFAHLISIDFFRDLLEAMKAVMHSGSNPEDSEQAPLTAADTRRRLLCSITAFQLLSGQGEALNLDLQDFYTEIYRLLLPMSLDPHITDAPLGSQETNGFNDSARPTKSALESEAELLTKGLELMFLKKRHISIPRAAAFIKRFSTSALNMPDSVIEHYLTFVKKLLTREPRLDALVQSEDKAGNGVYLPTLDDPELCNPFATSLYELYLYQVKLCSR